MKNETVALWVNEYTSIVKRYKLLNLEFNYLCLFFYQKQRSAVMREGLIFIIKLNWHNIILLTAAVSGPWS